ncbi:hypothetical protein [Hoyosella altamirensis]|uniref:hypothetical protein n=1 Tax=Hoyosella altamirensis TaxID=616997 RepID=UPI0012ECC0EF|nr:hypothetical protein [Hoyosella altamirensis]
MCRIVVSLLLGVAAFGAGAACVVEFGDAVVVEYGEAVPDAAGELAVGAPVAGV